MDGLMGILMGMSCNWSVATDEVKTLVQQLYTRYEKRKKKG
jgi:hypothetical protein